MRLAAAARLLAHLESVQRDPKKHGGGDGQHRQFLAVWPQPRVRKQSLLSELRSEGRAVVSKDPQKDLPATKARSSQGVLVLNQKPSWDGVLKNLKKKHEHDEVQDTRKNAKLCDPTLDEADVGLLSCGFNYYCAESHESFLGGVCVEAVNGGNQQPRHLQDGSDVEIDFAAACDPTNPYFSQCDCTMFDTVSGDGYVQCLFYEDYCFEDCPSLCLDLNVGQQLTSNTTDSYTYCYSFFGSYEKEICYTSLENGCSISFDGIPCNSCEPVSCNSTNITGTEDAFAWDCVNVPDGTQGSYCGETYFIPALDFATTCPGTNSTNATSAAPSGSVVPSASIGPSASTGPTMSNAPFAMEADSLAPTPLPTTTPPTTEPPVTNSPVVAAAPPTPTTTSGSGYFYGTGSSVWIVVWTSLVTGMAIALSGSTGGYY